MFLVTLYGLQSKKMTRKKGLKEVFGVLGEDSAQ
jgi:hypothetical protein